MHPPMAAPCLVWRNPKVVRIFVVPAELSETQLTTEHLSVPDRAGEEPIERAEGFSEPGGRRFKSCPRYSSKGPPRRAFRLSGAGIVVETGHQSCARFECGLGFPLEFMIARG